MGAQLTYRLEGVVDIAKYLEPYTLNMRHAFHEIPELGWEEEKTLALIEEEIRSIVRRSRLSYEIVHKEGGLWVDLHIHPNKPRVLFRADIDGLPIQEDTGLPFTSTHPGKMHACGHDCHSAMLLAAFKAIALEYIESDVNIRFVWQRAEEFTALRSGGQRLVEEGVCEDVDYAYALHISSTEQPGLFQSRQGVMMANSAQIRIGIACSGGHVMNPEIGSNAIYIMTDILNTLRGFENLFFSPDEPIAFVPSIAQSGVTANIRPAQAEMCFALRNFLPEKERNRFVRAVKEKVYAITKTYPTARVSQFTLIPGYPPLHNDPENVRNVEQALLNMNFQTATADRLFAGEDFSYYLQRVPGSFWNLGMRNHTVSDHHSSKFNPDERYLWQGVAFWLTLLSLKIDNA